MKKLVYTVFIAFWAAIATLLAVDMLAPGKETPASAPDTADPEQTAGSAGYSLDVVAEHDTLDDCWMAIEGVVYDLTDYVPRHPAAPSVLEPWCGREATVGMRTKGDSADHSARAWRMLERYRIGDLRDTDPTSDRQK